MRRLTGLLAVTALFEPAAQLAWAHRAAPPDARLAWTHRAAPPALPVVAANDNRRAAGTMRGDTLFVALDVRMARWYPEDSGGAFVEAPVLGEVGRAPQVPGPLLRVRAGTTIAVRFTNALSDSTITLLGMHTRPGIDSVQVPPGATLGWRFTAGTPGTYVYRAIAGSVNDRDREREQLTGAFVVDARGARADDRVFVINIWRESKDSQPDVNAITINGRSWPYTERLRATRGDTVRWRVVNGTRREHPMHLHGFFFRMLTDGVPGGDSAVAPSAQQHRVTYEMQPFSAMRMEWVAAREGNWLFHCHLAFHVIPEARLTPVVGHADHGSADATRHMAGLVMGIAVTAPSGATCESRAGARALRLHVQSARRAGRITPALGAVLEHGAAPAADSLPHASSLLLLTRGQPTDITVLNHLDQATAIHWHGIELESYSDGVAGWSGAMNRLAPAIAPRDSFTARLTLKRAGTFIYHTHLNDVDQLTRGLYGPIVVLEPGQRFDPRTDHLFVVGWDVDSTRLNLVVNGDTTGAPLAFAAGVHHRLRFVFISPAEGGDFALRADTTVQTWTPIARDGWDLPQARRRPEPAKVSGWAGQTFDFDFLPPRPGVYTLIAGDPKKPDWQGTIVVR
ncbi:MAG: multicopper oxidase domain-containing protein [Gemmatimonadetes bacterium]|nr:multicopper oxidase domain-containing protein [Gemmatimonadota bacterium]